MEARADALSVSIPEIKEGGWAGLARKWSRAAKRLGQRRFMVQYSESYSDVAARAPERVSEYLKARPALEPAWSGRARF